MTDNFALEAVVSAAPYSNIHVRANDPVELVDRLASDNFKKALDLVRLHAAEGNLAESGLKPKPVNHAPYNQGHADTVESADAAWTADQQGTQTQSYAREKPAPGSDPNQCAHGARVRREGTNSRGAWVGFFCPLPKERKAEQCSPVWGK